PSQKSLSHRKHRHGTIHGASIAFNARTAFPGTQPAMKETSPASGLAELPHLATFAVVAERRGFTAAAGELGITQAAVSQRIAALENELRVSLFDRRAGRTALTEAGERLYRYARSILDLHGRARAEVGGFRATVSGDLPLAASSVPGECFLPALLSAF